MFLNEEDKKIIKTLEPNKKLTKLEMVELYRPFVMSKFSKKLTAFYLLEKLGRNCSVQELENKLLTENENDSTKYQKFLDEISKKDKASQYFDLYRLYLSLYHYLDYDMNEDDSKYRQFSVGIYELSKYLIHNDFDIYGCFATITQSILGIIEDLQIDKLEDIQKESIVPEIIKMSKHLYDFIIELEFVADDVFAEKVIQEDNSLFGLSRMITNDFLDRLHFFKTYQDDDSDLIYDIVKLGKKKFEDLVSNEKNMMLYCESLMKLTSKYGSYICMDEDVNPIDNTFLDEKRSLYESVLTLLLSIKEHLRDRKEQEGKLLKDDINDIIYNKAMTSLDCYPFFENYVMTGKSQLLNDIYSNEEDDDMEEDDEDKADADIVM